MKVPRKYRTKQRNLCHHYLASRRNQPTVLWEKKRDSQFTYRRGVDSGNHHRKAIKSPLSKIFTSWQKCLLLLLVPMLGSHHSPKRLRRTPQRPRITRTIIMPTPCPLGMVHGPRQRQLRTTANPCTWQIITLDILMRIILSCQTRVWRPSCLPLRRASSFRPCATKSKHSRLTPQLPITKLKTLSRVPCARCRTLYRLLYSRKNARILPHPTRGSCLPCGQRVPSLRR